MSLDAEIYDTLTGEKGFVSGEGFRAQGGPYFTVQLDGGAVVERKPKDVKFLNAPHPYREWAGERKFIRGDRVELSARMYNQKYKEPKTSSELHNAVLGIAEDPFTGQITPIYSTRRIDSLHDFPKPGTLGSVLSYGLDPEGATKGYNVHVRVNFDGFGVWIVDENLLNRFP